MSKLEAVAEADIFPVACLRGFGQREAAEAEAFVPALLILVVGGHFRAFFEAVHHLVVPFAFRGHTGVAAVFPAQLVFGRAGGVNGVQVQGPAAGNWQGKQAQE